MIVACLKWVSHPGEPSDERFAGASPADRAALELALRQAEATGDTVTAITVGPPGADRVLREAGATGARRLVRVDANADPAAALSSDATAAAIAHAVQHVSADTGDDRPVWVWCGDYSLDRGSGSTPAFLAAALGARQALGCISVEPHGHGAVRVVRRLDGGRRELLEVTGPAVVSVEGSVASLRRAGLAAVRDAGAAAVEVLATGHDATPGPGAVAAVRPYRPRARALAAPGGTSTLERLRALTDAAAGGAARGETVELSPADAAQRIMRALAEWGCLEAPRH